MSCLEDICTRSRCQFQVPRIILKIWGYTGERDPLFLLFQPIRTFGGGSPFSAFPCCLSFEVFLVVIIFLSFFPFFFFKQEGGKGWVGLSDRGDKVDSVARASRFRGRKGFINTSSCNKLSYFSQNHNTVISMTAKHINVLPTQTIRIRIGNGMPYMEYVDCKSMKIRGSNRIHVNFQAPMQDRLDSHTSNISYLSSCTPYYTVP